MNKVLEHYFLDKVSPRLFVFLFDVFLIVLSALSVFVFYYGTDVITSSTENPMLLFAVVGSLLVFNSLSFLLFKTYRGVLRFSIFSDLVKVVYALSLGHLLTFIALFVFNTGLTHMALFRILLSVFFYNVLLMLFSRILIKELYETLTDENKKITPVFIYGAQHMAVSLGESIRRGREMKFRLKGFVTKDSDMIGKKLLGVDVYEFNDQVYDVLRNKNVKTVIFSQDRLDDSDSKEVLESFIDNGISLLTTVSPFSEWKGSITSKNQLKEVQIEDLLPRRAISMDLKIIASNLEGKRVMITGAAGSIGSEIVRQVAAFNPLSLILVDQAESPLHDLSLEIRDSWVNINHEAIVADITNKSRMVNIFEHTEPEYIFHAAAYKHVPMMEDNVSESVQNNIRGTKNIADLAVRYGVQKFVMVSTDKAVNPSNVMGSSKRICEIYVQSLAKYLESNNKNEDITQFITTRFGNVLGSNGSVIPYFREQIRNGGPVTVTHPEIIRYFMTITEACQLVLEAGSIGNGGEIYIFDMGKPVKILDLAKRMISLSGAKNVKIEFTGLRHGEKLFEELLSTEENTIKTHHEKIMIAKVQEYDYEEMNKKVEDLIEASYEYDDMKTVQKMKELVPEFKSLNSPFERIDKSADAQND